MQSAWQESLDAIRGGQPRTEAESAGHSSSSTLKKSARSSPVAFEGRCQVWASSRLKPGARQRVRLESAVAVRAQSAGQAGGAEAASSPRPQPSRANATVSPARDPVLFMCYSIERVPQTTQLRRFLKTGSLARRAILTGLETLRTIYRTVCRKVCRRIYLR